MTTSWQEDERTSRLTVRYEYCKTPCYPPDLHPEARRLDAGLSVKQAKQNNEEGREYKMALRVMRDAPEDSLQLEWVHGYNGNITRTQNLVRLRSGEIAYPASAAVVMLGGEKAAAKALTQRFFLGHDDDVTALAVHPDGVTVASGQLKASDI